MLYIYLCIINGCLKELSEVFMVRHCLVALLLPGCNGLLSSSRIEMCQGRKERKSRQRERT